MPRLTGGATGRAIGVSLELPEESLIWLEDGNASVDILFHGEVDSQSNFTVNADDGTFRSWIPAPAAGAHRAAICFRSPRATEPVASREIQITSFAASRPGQSFHCSLGAWQQAESSGYRVHQGDGRLCWYVPWWAGGAERSEATAHFGAATRYLFGHPIRRDPTFPLFCLLLGFLALLGLRLAAWRGKVSHLAVHISNSGDFRNAPTNRWVTFNLRFGAVAKLHKSLTESTLVLSRKGAGVQVTASDPFVVQQPSEFARQVSTIAVKAGSVVIAEGQKFAFINARTAKAIESRKFEPAVPSADDIRFAETEDALERQLRKRFVVSHWARRLAVTLTLAVWSFAIPFAGARWVPELTQRTPFVLGVLGVLAATGVLLRLTNIGDRAWFGVSPDSKLEHDLQPATR